MPAASSGRDAFVPPDRCGHLSPTTIIEAGAVHELQVVSEALLYWLGRAARDK